ncbi:hypothetical protein D3C87_1498780 [compost metagenome]
MRSGRSVWPGRACAQPDPQAAYRPAMCPAVRQRRGQRHWSGARWPCRARSPVYVDVNPWGRAGGRFPADRHPPGPVTATRLRRIPATPFPGRLQDRSTRSRCHRRPPSGTPADAAPSVAPQAVASLVFGRSARAAAAHSGSSRICVSCSPANRHAWPSTGISGTCRAWRRSVACHHRTGGIPAESGPESLERCPRN